VSGDFAPKRITVYIKQILQHTEIQNRLCNISNKQFQIMVIIINQTEQKHNLSGVLGDQNQEMNQFLSW